MAVAPTPAFGVLHVDVSSTPDAVVIRLTGELDMATAPKLEAAFRHAGRDHALVIVDLRSLTFLGSAGLSAIVAGHRAVTEDGRRCVVVEGPPAVKRVFAITHTDDVLDIVEAPPVLPRRGARHGGLQRIELS